MVCLGAGGADHCPRLQHPQPQVPVLLLVAGEGVGSDGSFAQSHPSLYLFKPYLVERVVFLKVFNLENLLRLLLLIKQRL